MSERSTRQARQLVRRLARDCNFEWPGGEENAALLYDRSARRWELRCIDSTPGPVICGPTPLAHLLRDGFVLIRWPDDQIELFHVETVHTQLSHRLDEAEVAKAGE